MDYLNWNSELNTGVFEIDGQHRRILYLINRLNRLAAEARASNVSGEGSAMLAPLFPEKGMDYAEILAAIDDLIHYTLDHFSFEEALMENAGHPLTDEHEASHQAFRHQVVEMRNQFVAGLDVLGELLALLGHWLYKHIAHDDMDLAEMNRRAALSTPANADFLMPTMELFKEAAA